MSDSDPLHHLELDTTIRLRRVLRDIRSRRTKLMPPSNDDLALLEQRGLITMNDGEPALADAANSVIDQSGARGISDE
jgi:hypothetical protein